MCLVVVGVLTGCTGGSGGAISHSSPSGSGFAAAKRQWLSSVAVGGSASQGIPFERAISDLRHGYSTDKNTSAYPAAIVHLRSLVNFPDAMVTPSEDARFTRDAMALDAFFGTPRLYAK